MEAKRASLWAGAAQKTVMFRAGLYVNIHHGANNIEGSFVVKQEYHLPGKGAWEGVFCGRFGERPYSGGVATARTEAGADDYPKNAYCFSGHSLARSGI
jgi:hypothetical protein